MGQVNSINHSTLFGSWYSFYLSVFFETYRFPSPEEGVSYLPGSQNGLFFNLESEQSLLIYLICSQGHGSCKNHNFYYSMCFLIDDSGSHHRVATAAHDHALPRQYLYRDRLVIIIHSVTRYKSSQ